MKIGIAGGIGSGKSYVCQIIRRYGFDVYDCDAAAKRLMCESDEVRQALIALIGPDAYTADGLNKPVISQFVLASQDNKKAVNDIVHPVVFRDFEESGLLWMESAIMFESGICSLVDRVVAVVAPKELRIQRVMARDGKNRQEVEEWMARQMPQKELIHKADFVVVNDGQSDLEKQLKKIIDLCNRQF